MWVWLLLPPTPAPHRVARSHGILMAPLRFTLLMEEMKAWRSVCARGRGELFTHGSIYLFIHRHPRPPPPHTHIDSVLGAGDKK